MNRTQENVLLVVLGCIALLLLGWVGMQLSQDQGVVAQETSTASPVPTDVQLQPIDATIITNDLEDTAATTTAYLGDAQLPAELATIFSRCTYQAVMFTNGEGVVEVDERGSVWFADDKVGTPFQGKYGYPLLELPDEYQFVAVIREKMIFDLEYISNLDVEPGPYRVFFVIPETFDAEMGDGIEVTILGGDPDTSINESFTMMVCQRN